MRAGPALFGSGGCFDNGAVVPAYEAAPIASDPEFVSAAIDGLQRQRGFSNATQPLQATGDMFADGRGSDGRRARARRATAGATAPKENGALAFVTPIGESTTKSLTAFGSWTSAPGETNCDSMPGPTALFNDEPDLAQKRPAKSCSRTFSSAQKPEGKTLHRPRW